MVPAAPDRGLYEYWLYALPQRPAWHGGGAAGAHSALKERERGPLSPALALLFGCRAAQRAARQPNPAAPVETSALGGGGGGVPGAGPLAPPPEQARCRAAPGSGRVGCAHPPPPPRPLEPSPPPGPYCAPMVAGAGPPAK